MRGSKERKKGSSNIVRADGYLCTFIAAVQSSFAASPQFWQQIPLPTLKKHIPYVLCALMLQHAGKRDLFR